MIEMNNLKNEKTMNVKIEMGVSIPVLVTEDEMFNHFKDIYDGMLNDGIIGKDLYNHSIELLIKKTIEKL